MGWVLMKGDSAEVELHGTGRIEWNEAAHVMLGEFGRVEVYLEKSKGRLGLKAVEAGADAIAVQANGSGYFVDARQRFADAELILTESWAATPHKGSTTGPDIWIELPPAS